MVRVSSPALVVLLAIFFAVACGDDDEGREPTTGTPSGSALASAVGSSPQITGSLAPTAARPAATVTTEATPTNTVEEAVIAYVTTTGLDIVREMSDPLYCQDLGENDVEQNAGKICIGGAPPAGAGATSGTPINVSVGLPFSDGVWILTLEVSGGAWTVTGVEQASGEGL